MPCVFSTLRPRRGWYLRLVRRLGEKDGFFHACVVAMKLKYRVLTTMLESLLRWRWSMIKLRASPLLCDREAIRIAILLPRLGRLGDFDKEFMFLMRNLLLMVWLGECRSMLVKWQEAPQKGKFHCTRWAEEYLPHLRSVLDRLPCGLLDAPADDRVCWECKKIVEEGLHQKCRRCRMARYCTEACYKKHWKKHKKACETLSNMFCKEDRQEIKRTLHEVAKVFEGGERHKVTLSDMLLATPNDEYVRDALLRCFCGGIVFRDISDSGLCSGGVTPAGFSLAPS